MKKPLELNPFPNEFLTFLDPVQREVIREVFGHPSVPLEVQNAFKVVDTETRRRPTLIFDWTGPHEYLIGDLNGPRAIRTRHKGLIAAWYALAAQKTGQQHLSCDLLFDGKQPGKQARQALVRAAKEVEPVCPPLASLILGMTTCAGVIRPPRSPSADVVPRMSLLRGVTSA